jgi:asparagine synthase (glutamine-hydrolysing)
MCGISGIINFNGKAADETQIRLMMKTMKHRGPDDDGTFIEQNIGLGFVRLSILDLNISGHQPMFDQSGRYVIVFNGEIYNYIEIREILKAKGYSFKSATDTEVLLNSYIEWGQNCLDNLNGMFAFTIYDREAKTLFIARDHFGIKPFYYYIDNDRFIFASEIPPILSVLENKPSPNLQSVFDFLAFNRTDQTENTFFEGIKKLQHGNSCLIHTTEKGANSLKNIKRWYNLAERVKNAEGFKSPEEYRAMFSSAVGLQLRSDVPVGVSLSGGLDSSSLTSVLLKDYNKEDLHTFSAVYGKGQTGDESEFVNEYKPLLKNMSFTTPTGESLFKDKEDFVRAHGEPIPSPRPYSQFKVMELARKNVVVTLDGQGADEQLGGYHYFFGLYFKELLRKGQLFSLVSEAASYMKNHKSLYGLKSFIYFLLPENLKIKTRVAEKGYIDKDFLKQYGTNNAVTTNIYGSNSLNQSFLDHFEFKLEHLLKWEDINGMWFSLESRVPFLDYRLVEKTLALQPNQVIHKGTTKYILREALKGTLPEKIRARKDKIGFDNPADDWFRAIPYQNLLKDIFENGYFFKEGIIDREITKKRYQLHLDGKINIHLEIWKWIHLNMWYDMFIK